MSERFPITIYHNPNCGTSRDSLARIRAAGFDPTVVEYLKAGWTQAQLRDLFHRMGVRPRDVLRVRGTPAEDLGLTKPGVADAAILKAMALEPILVERPIVVTRKGVALCRPAERLESLL